MKRSLLDRFQEKYSIDQTTGCWNWAGATDTNGYGALSVDGRCRKAHRVAYELFMHPIPDGSGHHGTCVCHRCDNPRCVNPGHLFLGSVGDNNRDMHAKGRGNRGLPIGYSHAGWNMRRGENHPSARLKQNDVTCIRSSSESLSVLAARYGVSKTMVSRIKRNKAWKTT